MKKVFVALFIIAGVCFLRMYMENNNSLPCEPVKGQVNSYETWFNTNAGLLQEAATSTRLSTDSINSGWLTQNGRSGTFYIAGNTGSEKNKTILPEVLLRAKERERVHVSRGTSGRGVWPTRGTITSPYGIRWGRLHAGIDIANDWGTKVIAARAGKVVFAGWQPGYGKTIILEHGMGWTSLYGHLAEVLVSTDDYPGTGETIAYMGSTGNSTGPHLHFEVRWGGNAVNPSAFFSR